MGAQDSLLVGKTCHEAVFGRPMPCPQCPMVPHASAKPFKPRECEDVIDGRAVQQAMYPLIAEDGSLSGVVSIIRDISERKMEEDEFRLMHEELVRAHATLQGSVEQLKAAQAQLIQSEKMAAVGQLISGVAHELNNPLTGIIGYSQLISDAGDASNVSPEKLTRYSALDLVREAGAQGTELMAWIAARAALPGHVTKVHSHYHVPISNTAGGLLALQNDEAEVAKAA